MTADSPGCWIVDVYLSGPGCKDRALWLWNSCVEESQGSRVKPCLELGRNEKKVLITTLMPACQSPPAGLSRFAPRVDPSDQSKQTQKQFATLWSVMKAAQEFISHWGLKINHFNNSFFKKSYLSGYHLRENLTLQQDVKAYFSLQSRSTNQV